MAFNLDQAAMDRFVERMARALLYQENAVVYADCDFAWKKSLNEADLDRIPPDIRAVLLSGKPKDIGDGVFSYVGYFFPGKASSLWLLNFYGGIEFMVRVRGKTKKQEHS